MEANNNGNNNHIPNITMTVIFEGSALNRNEKIGGNILSIKKIHVNGKECAFISKVALRHYLFHTLKTAFNWKESQLAVGKEVIQFNVVEDNIFSSPELDAFGYMFTDEKTLTRKSPVGLTKAISLSPYNQDLPLYSNHDLVRRSNERGNFANPNLYSKEEFSGLFKFSITIDSEKIGKDFFIVDNIVDSSNNLTIELVKPEKAVLDDVEEEDSDSEKIYKYKGQNLQVNGNIIQIPASLLKKNKPKNGKNEISLQAIPDVSFNKDEIKQNADSFIINIKEIKRDKKNKIEKIVLNDDEEIYFKFKRISDNNIVVTTGKDKKEHKIIIEEKDKIIQIPKELFDENSNNTISLQKEILKQNNFFKTELSVEEIEAINEENPYCFILNEEPIYDSETRKLILKKGLSFNIDYINKKISSTLNNYCETPFDYITKDENCIHIEKIKGNNKYQVTFLLSKKLKSERIEQILKAINNGLISHSSGEINTLTPLFIIAGDVKVPSPIFHSFIDVKKSDGGNFEVIGIEDAVKNGWLEGNIYIKDCVRLKAQIPSEFNKKDDWNEFLRSVNLSNNVNNESSTN